jgi:hypothetical protein
MRAAALVSVVLLFGAGTMLGVLGAGCRDVLGIDDSQAVIDDADGGADGRADDAATADGGAAPFDGASPDATTDGGSAKDAGHPLDACAPCMDGGCGIDQDCADPITQKCATQVCTARTEWGTLHMDLPGGAVDLTDQYFGDYNNQGADVLIRIQDDKGYVVWSVQLPSTATVGTVPFSPASPAVIAVNVVDTALGASKGFWNGTGTITLSKMSTTSGGEIAGTFTGTFSESGPSTMATFTGQFYVRIP